MSGSELLLDAVPSRQHRMKRPERVFFLCRRGTVRGTVREGGDNLLRWCADQILVFFWTMSVFANEVKQTRVSSQTYTVAAYVHASSLDRFVPREDGRSGRGRYGTIGFVFANACEA